MMTFSLYYMCELQLFSPQNAHKRPRTPWPKWAWIWREKLLHKLKYDQYFCTITHTHTHTVRLTLDTWHHDAWKAHQDQWFHHRHHRLHHLFLTFSCFSHLVMVFPRVFATCNCHRSTCHCPNCQGLDAQPLTQSFYKLLGNQAELQRIHDDWMT